MNNSKWRDKIRINYNPDMERVHRKNAARLEEIINAIGYPTVFKIGKAASEAAYR